ncbi:MAG TPA: dihydrodipicolinate synthase family protein [bacterium]|nr:dihydrodipicolinate synthase family protein [bacterium]
MGRSQSLDRKENTDSMRIPAGVWPVFLTPYLEDSTVDLAGVEALADFYLSAGVEGFFVSCLSSEVHFLTEEERLAINRRMVSHLSGKVPVVAGGNFGDTLSEQVESMKRVYDTGVNASVVFLSHLPNADHLVDQALELADRVDAPLGIYECPLPVHRLLSPDQVGTLAQTGRFVFMKETSADLQMYRAKIEAAKGTPLTIFQANLPNLPMSLETGCPGMCGVIGNVCPELTDRLCKGNFESGETRQKVFESLVALHTLMKQHTYPSSAKYILQKRGVNITTQSRSVNPRLFLDENRAAIDEFLKTFRFDGVH